jgi:hypothetical protein
VDDTRSPRYVGDVPLRDHGAFDPFGWSVGCAGLKPAQVREEMRRMVEWAAETWALYFPSERGYEVAVESPAGPSNGVQLAVRRGDFRANVALECILDPGRKAPGALAIRMFGRAGSSAVVAAERASNRLTQRGRSVGIGMGLGSFASLAWLALGTTHAGALVITGLLIVVAGLMSTTALATAGAWIGERIGESGRERARALSSGDPRLHDDLRRWRALVRQLATQRSVLASQLGRTPFRSLPTGRTRTAEIPALPRASFAS